MSFVLTEEQQLLQESAESFFREQSPVDEIRQLRDSKDSLCYRPELWKKIVEMGWTATSIPENYGGIGFGFKGLGVVLQESGRTLAPSPLFSSAVLGASAILLAGSEKQKQQWLPKIASGEAIFSFALQETAVHNPKSIACTARKSGDNYLLSGTKTFVTDGAVADYLVVVCRTAGEAADREGISLLLADTKQQGVTVERQVMVDTRNMAAIQFDNVEVPAVNLLGEEGAAYQLLHQILDRANAALCTEMLGSIEEVFETTLEYIKEREQFGQPVGSFQALQHRCAEMFCEIELAKTLVMRALSAIDEEDQGAGQGDLPLAVSAAKVHLCETYKRVTNEGVQMRGGMGVTDEMDVGLFLKRARVVIQLFGDDSYHLQRYASLRGY